MLRLRAMAFRAALILLTCWLAGCYQADHRPQQEEDDPHFQKGRALADSQDFNGAAHEFELALEDDPHSAAAHLELGWLYDTRLNDYAAAIYHYERHLLYKPDSKRAIEVKERIRGCMQQLANGEFVLPEKDLERAVDRLKAENAALKQQLDALKKQPPPVAVDAVAAPDQPVAAGVGPASPGPAATVAAAGAARPHTHKVRSHETICSIASAYRIKTSAILAANPRVNPRRLHVGQVLYLP